MYWRRRWHPTPVLLPGKSHGQRSLVGSGVAKNWTRLSDFIFIFHFYALEKEMATHSSVLDWRITGTGEPGGLLSMGSRRVRHDWSDLAAAGSHIYFGISNILSILPIPILTPSKPKLLLQVLSCVWLFCNPMDWNPAGFFVHGISQARILEWVAISFSRLSEPTFPALAGGFFITEPPRKS